MISTLKVSFAAQVSMKWLVRQSLCCQMVHVNDCKWRVNRCCCEPLCGLETAAHSVLTSFTAEITHSCFCHQRVCAAPLHLPPHFADEASLAKACGNGKGCTEMWTQGGGPGGRCVCYSEACECWEHVETKHGPTLRWGGRGSEVEETRLNADLTERNLVILLCWETMSAQCRFLYKHNENQFHNLLS